MASVYHEMFATHGKGFDAVIVNTPDDLPAPMG